MVNKSKVFARVCLVFILLLVWSLVQAENYFVSTNGNNSNTGTESEPFQTIQYALDNIVNNLDTLFIEGGTYNERITLENYNNVSQPITITSYNGIAIIDGSGIELYGPHEGLFELKYSSHIVIDNIRVQNAEYIGILVFGNNISNITIRNCYTYNTGASGIYANGQAAFGTYGISDLLIENNIVELAVNLSPGGYEECISLTEGVENFIIRNNEVFNGGLGSIVGGPIGIDAKNGVKNGEIYKNIAYDINNSSAGIYVDAYERAALNIRVYQNEIFNCEDIGISVGAEQGGTVDSIYIYNNIIYNNGSDGIKITGFSTDGSPNNIKKIWIYNNTVYRNGFQDLLGGANQGGAIWIEGNTDTVVVMNNIFSDNNFNNGIYIYSSNSNNVIVANNLIYENVNRSWFNPPMEEIDGQNAITSNPIFMDADNHNFSLSPTSPAIDAGNDSLYPDVDFNDTPRPLGAGIDLGAIEYNQPVSTTSLDIESELIFKLFPNPVRDNKITILANEALKEKVIITIYDRTGRNLNYYYEMNLGEMEYTIDVAKLPSGLYDLYIICNDKILNQTIVKLN